MEKQKCKNDEAPGPLTPIVRHSIWFFLLFSYVSQIVLNMLSFFLADNEYRLRFACRPIYSREYLLIDNLLVNLALTGCWFLADEWFHTARNRWLIRGLIILYLCVGRWLISKLFVAYAC